MENHGVIDRPQHADHEQQPTPQRTNETEGDVQLQSTAPHQCSMCGKIFDQESTHKRHYYYCRSKPQGVSTSRRKSCLVCVRAKTRCTKAEGLGNPNSGCLRCSERGVQCELAGLDVQPSSSAGVLNPELDKTLDFSFENIPDLNMDELWAPDFLAADGWDVLVPVDEDKPVRSRDEQVLTGGCWKEPEGGADTETILIGTSASTFTLGVCRLKC